MVSQNQIQKIAVFRALQLGDLLCAIPAVRALRASFPNAQITLIGLPWAKDLVARFGQYFDKFICFPGYPGLPEQAFDASKFEEFTEAVIAEKYDLLLQMQGNGTIVNEMLKMLQPQIFAGFNPIGDVTDDDTQLVKYPDYGHEIDRHLALMSFLGIPSQGDKLEFPLFPQDEEELERSGLSLEAKTYVCIHPGSRGSWRQWPPLFFAAIGNYCSSLGYTIVLTGTPGEMEIIKHVASLLDKEPVIAAGRTTLGSLGVLIKDSAAIICNCTGVSHVASALNVPAVVISMDGEPWRWAPKDSALQRCVDWTRNLRYDNVFQEVTTVFSALNKPEKAVL